MAAPQASSRLEMLQARFQQRQLLEKEQKLLQLYDQQQLRAHQVAQRGSAGSNGSNSSGNGTSSTVSHHQTVTRTTTSTHSNSNSPAGGKVRQMFDERRQTTVKGIDKSYPLEPLDNRSRKGQSTTTTSNVVTSTTSPLKNGNPMSNRQSLVVRRTVRSEANSNVNGGKPIVSYHEEVSRESCGPTERDNELEEFGDDDNRDSRYANGNRQVDEQSEVHIEDVTNENTTQRHRTTAKIHLGEYDGGIEANRVGDNLENEQFPEDFAMDAPDRLPRRAPPPKKPSQSEARLERFKNSNTKRPGQIAKQVAGNTTSYTKKRIETSVNSGSTSRASTATRTEVEEEEETTTPQVGRTGGPRSSTPEERARKLTHPVVDRASIVTRPSGVSKVSQLTHKNSMDFYPRRKSEFEKSKTFRKLQLELGESSPEPEEVESLASRAKPAKKRGSILDDDVYSPGRRSTSSSPIYGGKTCETREENEPASPYFSRRKSSTSSPIRESPIYVENPSETREENESSNTYFSRRKSSTSSPIRESPIYVKKSSETREENETSSAYFSRRKSSTSSLTTGRDVLEERRTSRETSPERPASRKRSESPVDPIYERKSSVTREETRMSDGGRRSTSVESNFYSSRRRSSSNRPTEVVCPAKGRGISRGKTPGSESPIYGRKSVVNEEINTGRNILEERRISREKSLERRQPRKESESPIYGRKSVVNEGINTGRNILEERRISREKSPERRQPRKESESPIYGRKSVVNEETMTTEQTSSVYHAERRSSSASPTPADDSPRERRRDSRGASPDRLGSRRQSESPIDPIYERKSMVKKEETRTVDGGRRSTTVEANFYSTKRGSSNTRHIGVSRAEKGRRTSREKSPDRPQMRKRSESPVYGRKTASRKEEIRTTSSGTRTKTTRGESGVWTSRHRSSSSGPTSIQDARKERRNSREITPERPQSRRGSESPVCGRKSSFKTTDRVSTIYSSERRSSSSSPAPGQRSQSRETSPERPQSRRGSESPVYARKSSLRNEEKKTASSRMKTTDQMSSSYYSERRSSSSSPAPREDPETRRRLSREMTPERPQSRRGSESPVYEGKSSLTNVKKTTERHQSRRGSESPVCGRKSSLKNEEKKTTSSMTKTTGHVSSVYSSERRSSSSTPAPGQRRRSREMTPERPEPRRGSESPVYGRKSSLRNDENKSRNVETKTTELHSNVYDSRRRSSSATPTSTQRGRPNSREISPERPASRGGSASPVHRRRSIVTSEETRTTREGGKAMRTDRRVPSEESTMRNETPICIRMTRDRSESPRRDFRGASADPEEPRVKIGGHGTSGETLRSVELVKKLARSGGTDNKITTSARRSVERKTTLEDVELLRSKSRSKSPPHRVVKKDRVVMDDDKDRSNNENARRNSNEPRPTTKTSRSRTASPSPSPSPSSMKETASFRAKKTERKDSSELKGIDTRNRYRQEDRKIHEIGKTNLSHEKAKTCDLSSAIRDSSPEDPEDRSRRSSAEIGVKRHDTFKVKKPSERIMKIERESSVDDDADFLPIDIPIKVEARGDRPELLERIEKIRTTLSKTGRSEQNLHEAKDFERTDSVESALRRFDSIGVETEHHVTVGAEDVDRACVSPEPARRGSAKEIGGQEKKIARKSVEARSKSVKRGVEPSRGKNSRVNPRQSIAETKKSVRTKKEKSATTTPRESAKTRVGQKIATSLVRKSELRGEESSGRGEGRIGARSPDCKRRLFEDSESEIDTENSRSTVVMSAITTVTKSTGLMEIEPRNNRENLKIGSDKTIRSDSSIREVRAEQEPTRILRSIEDIRKSIKRESQDFKRELNIFNTAMRRDEEMSSSVSSSVTPDAIGTSGIVSCVKITKTLRTGDVEPVVKIERSTVKLPITHRIAKSPSPDIGTRRSTEGRARTPTASVRRSVHSSPAKSPDAAARYGSADFKSAGPRPSARGSPSPSSAREDRVRSETSRTAEYTDCTDGPADHSELTITETVTTTSTKRNDAFVVELDDDDVPRGKDVASSSQGKPPPRKQSAEKSLTSQRPQRSPNTTPLPRPASALSTSSTGSARGQSSQINSKSRMSTKTKTSPAPNGPKRPSEGARASTAAATNDGLSPCKICGRRFNSDRISLHEQICAKTATKKRKQFDATIHRVKGTELESFVVKKGATKKGPADRKTSKPEVKSNWRRKHEDFINAIRSAKQVQAHLAAGGKLSDLPPPPPSDTSDYVQCPHCGRKFNQGAADRHIPKCQNMMHNKPNPRAPPKPKR